MLHFSPILGEVGLRSSSVFSGHLVGTNVFGCELFCEAAGASHAGRARLAVVPKCGSSSRSRENDLQSKSFPAAAPTLASVGTAEAVPFLWSSCARPDGRGRPSPHALRQAKPVEFLLIARTRGRIRPLTPHQLRK